MTNKTRHSRYFSGSVLAYKNVKLDMRDVVEITRKGREIHKVCLAVFDSTPFRLSLLIGSIWALVFLFSLSPWVSILVGVVLVVYWSLEIVNHSGAPFVYPERIVLQTDAELHTLYIWPEEVESWSEELQRQRQLALSLVLE